MAPRRVIIDRPGGYDRLRVEPFEPGRRRPGHVRIAVEAIGVNYADCVARMGLYASAAKYVGWPLVPGFEVAGRVAQADPSSPLREGDPVVAILGLARRAGAETVGVVGRTHKVAVARELGATHVIDKSREDLFERARALAPKGYDVVLDANGAETLARSYDALASPGRLVVYGFHSMLPRRGGKPSWPRLTLSWLRTPRFDPLRMTGENRSVMAFNLSYLFDERAILERCFQEIWEGLATGELPLLPTRSFPLESVAEAHAALESGTTTGKLVLTCGAP